MNTPAITIDPLIVVGAREFVRFIEGHTYEDTHGATVYSGDEMPSQEDAEDCIASPRTPPAVPAPVPAEVPMWAIRAVLDLEGLTPAINAILAQIPEPQKTIVLRVWEYGNYIRRDSPTIAQLTAALGKTDAQVNDYFRLAATFNP
jgi:hypothetical protein